jgi:type I restriction enzyme, R subunit
LRLFFEVSYDYTTNYKRATKSKIINRLRQRRFLDRLQGEISKRGIVDVLLNGIKVYPESIVLFYAKPSKENKTAVKMYQKNIFSVTRQIHYSQDETRLSLDLCIFMAHPHNA